jgi:hypothetical protein
MLRPFLHRQITPLFSGRDHASRHCSIIAVLLIMLVITKSSEVPNPPKVLPWNLSVSALPSARLENERIQVALYSNDPDSVDLGMSVATQVPLHAVSSRGWSLTSDKSTWGFLFYEDPQLNERLRSSFDGPIIVGLGGNVACHVAPAELDCSAVVGGTWCVFSSYFIRSPPIVVDFAGTGGPSYRPPKRVPLHCTALNHPYFFR